MTENKIHSAEKYHLLKSYQNSMTTEFIAYQTVAMISIKYMSLFILVVALATAKMAMASDPDILSDFIAPAGNGVNGSFFTFTGMRGLFDRFPQNFTVTKASMKELLALDGQSVSYAVIQFPAGTTNPPHTHPRAAELLFLVYGTLEVGFVDTKNVLYTQKLQVGDMFVFPKGLVHFQYNPSKQPVIAISSFGSASPGTVSVPLSIFSTEIDDVILAKAFKTDESTIQKIKANFGKHQT